MINRWSVWVTPANLRLLRLAVVLLLAVAAAHGLAPHVFADGDDGGS